LATPRGMAAMRRWCNSALVVMLVPRESVRGLQSRCAQIVLVFSLDD
jgi:hypothetical protein